MQPEADECSCEKSRKIPKRELLFLADQRTQRKMAIGQTDKETTAALRKKEERKAKPESRASRSSDDDGLCTGEQPEEGCTHPLLVAFAGTNVK